MREDCDLNLQISRESEASQGHLEVGNGNRKRKGAWLGLPPCGRG